MAAFKKSIMMSIRPSWCRKIIQGEKSMEIRRTKPNLEPPFRCYIYCTKGNSKIVFENAVYIYPPPLHKPKQVNGTVIGEFICDRIFPIRVNENGSIQNWNYYELARSCVGYDDMAGYIGWGRTGYGWNISDLRIYDKPKYLTDFSGKSSVLYWPDWTYTGLKRPPQSWCYVEENGRSEEFLHEHS